MMIYSNVFSSAFQQYAISTLFILMDEKKLKRQQIVVMQHKTSVIVI